MSGTGLLFPAVQVEFVMNYSAQSVSPQVDFERDPETYRHWKLKTAGGVAELMDGARDKLLAGSALTQNEHRRIGGCNELDLLRDISQGRTGAQHRSKALLKSDFLLQVLVFLFQSFAEKLDLLPCVGMGDGDCSVVGDHP